MTDHTLEVTTTAVRKAAPRDVQVQPLGRRLMHWINAAAIIVMVGSGWRIYDSAPPLKWNFKFLKDITLGGDTSRAMAMSNDDGLANALLWHFGAMWVLIINFAAYIAAGIISGHFRRDFLPLWPKAFFRDLYAALRFRLGHRLGQYNAVQKAFYWGIMLVITVMILSGLSIWKPVQLHELTSLFGGYDTARIVHFFGMAAIVAFLLVHIVLTILVPKTLVAMIAGKASATAHHQDKSHSLKDRS